MPKSVPVACPILQVIRNKEERAKMTGMSGLVLLLCNNVLSNPLIIAASCVFEIEIGVDCPECRDFLKMMEVNGM